MKNIEDEEKDIEIPSDEDENVGEDGLIKKKHKRKKTKEEKIAERKTIFWTLLIILVATLIFWLLPIIKGTNKKSSVPESQAKTEEKKNSPSEKSERKNYVEITL
ncbi:MAG TPA: hypothetical protein PLI45_03985 [Candidatus Woesebacteria bacterium]|nr:hypothetical protein [Candidatus Woesebacteria bacterium]